MDKNKLISLYIDSILILLLLLPSIIVSIMIFCLTFYIHEIGHVIFGFIDNLLHLKLVFPYISNYVDCWFLTVPQQTKNIANSTLFAIGGSLFSLLVFGLFSYYANKKFKKNAIWLYPILILYSIREIIYNIILGTDNFKHLPLMNSQYFSLFSKFFDYITWIDTILIILFLYSIFLSKYKIKLINYFKIISKI